MRKARWWVRLVLLAAIGVAGCAGSPTLTPTPAAYRPVTESALRPGAPLPTPAGDVVLTLTGRLDPARAPGRQVELDLPGLEALGLVEMTVDDFFATGRIVVFQGVLLRDVLAAVGADPDADTLLATALDDYQVEIPLSDAYDLHVLIATRADGERMSIDQYGPIRLVYPFGALPLDPLVHSLRSAWQLNHLDVR